MRTITTVARLLLGLSFVVFGLNYFLGFLPQPPPHDPAAGAVLGGLVAGKIMGLVKIIEIAAGLALLSNRFVPLALALLAPILVNIVLFHGVFDPAGLVVPLGLVAFELVVAWGHRDAFAPMLRAHTAPVSAEVRLPSRPRSARASAA